MKTQSNVSFQSLELSLLPQQYLEDLQRPPAPPRSARRVKATVYTWTDPRRTGERWRVNRRLMTGGESWRNTAESDTSQTANHTPLSQSLPHTLIIHNCCSSRLLLTNQSRLSPESVSLLSDANVCKWAHQMLCFYNGCRGTKCVRLLSKHSNSWFNQWWESVGGANCNWPMAEEGVVRNQFENMPHY